MGVRMTSLDIQKKTFVRKKIGGVDEKEVLEFLAEVARDFEVLHAELRGQRDQAAELRQRVAEYSEMEKTLKATLVSAQKTSGELRQNAEKEAELLIRNAELTGERILDEARKEVRDLTEEVRGLKKLRRKLRIELKNLLDGYYDLLDEELPEGEEPLRSNGPRKPVAAAAGPRDGTAR